MSNLNIVEKTNLITLVGLLQVAKSPTATKEEIVELIEGRISDLKMKDASLEEAINNFTNKGIQK